MKTEGTEPADEDFNFTYEMGDDGKWWFTRCEHARDTWFFKSHILNEDFKDFKKNDPLALDVEMKAEAPGYIPGAYFGWEAIGCTPGCRQNPKTTWGMTRYIVLPNSHMKGAVDVGGKKRRIEGNAWYEHQWGNYVDVEKTKYLRFSSRTQALADSAFFVLPSFRWSCPFLLGSEVLQQHFF